MLREIGGECAGAVSLIPMEQSPTPAANEYEAISKADLIALLDQLPQRPLLAGKAEIRLSLAGAQNKVALCISEAGYALPLNESPSTHIIKPQAERFPGLVENEAYCLKLEACAEHKKHAGSVCYFFKAALLSTRHEKSLPNESEGFNLKMVPKGRFELPTKGL